jgi:hypothetical protein
MAIDTEPTNPPKLLKTYIDKSIQKAFIRHTQQLSLKEVRGASDTPPSPGASLKKKSENDQKAAAGRALAATRRKAENNQKAAAGRQAAAVVAGSNSVKKTPPKDR